MSTVWILSFVSLAKSSPSRKLDQIENFTSPWSRIQALNVISFFIKTRSLNVGELISYFFFYLQQTLEKSRIGWWITRHPKISWQLERCKTSVEASRLDLMRRNQWRFLLVQLLKTILDCRQLKFEVVFSFSPFILVKCTLVVKR